MQILYVITYGMTAKTQDCVSLTGSIVGTLYKKVGKREKVIRISCSPVLKP